MDLGLTETQELLKNAARDFLEKECPESLVREMEEDEKGYSPDLWGKMAEQGWQGLMIPEEYGGAGLDFLDLCVLLEEFGRALVPGPFISTVLGGAVPLHARRLGRSRSRSSCRRSPPATPSSRSPSPSRRLASTSRACRRRPTVSGNDVTINGTKLFVPDANVADYMVVAARSGAGVTLGHRRRRDQPGVQVTQLLTIAARQAVRGQAEQRQGPAARRRTARAGRLLAGRSCSATPSRECAYLVGLAQMDFEIAVDYAKERVQFGRPIGSFQAIQHKCADMVTDVDGSRFIMYKAAWSLEHGPGGQADWP